MRIEYIEIKYKDYQLKLGSILLIVILINSGLLIIITSDLYIMPEATIPPKLSSVQNDSKDQSKVIEQLTVLKISDSKEEKVEGENNK